MSNIENLIEELSKLTVLEASELVNKLEDHWGVKAASGGGMMMAAAPEAAAAEEQTEFDVILKGPGPKKIGVIKVVRELTGAGLKEAKGMVDDCPSTLKSGLSKDEAEGILAKLTEAGAEAELK